MIYRLWSISTLRVLVNTHVYNARISIMVDGVLEVKARLRRAGRFRLSGSRGILRARLSRVLARRTVRSSQVNPENDVEME